MRPRPTLLEERRSESREVTEPLRSPRRSCTGCARSWRPRADLDRASRSSQPSAPSKLGGCTPQAVVRMTGSGGSRGCTLHALPTACRRPPGQKESYAAHELLTVIPDVQEIRFHRQSLRLSTLVPVTRDPHRCHGRSSRDIRNPRGRRAPHGESCLLLAAARSIAPAGVRNHHLDATSGPDMTWCGEARHAVRNQARDGPITTIGSGDRREEVQKAADPRTKRRKPGEGALG